MSNTPSETITPEDDDDQKATVENPRRLGSSPCGFVPGSPASPRRRHRLPNRSRRTAGVNCSSESEDGRCDDHAIDLNLIAAYQRTAKNLDAAITAARERARAA